MDKSVVKQKIIELQEEAVSSLQKAVAELKESSDLDEQEGHDPEDYVHQQEATDLMRRMETQLDIAESDLVTVQTIPLAPCDTAKVGALIETDYLNFFVGISSLPFQVDGKKVVGVSTNAPIYLKLKGKKVGEKVSVGDKEYVINAIL